LEEEDKIQHEAFYNAVEESKKLMVPLLWVTLFRFLSIRQIKQRWTVVVEKLKSGANKMCMSYWCVAQVICGTWRNSSSRSKH
jgi:hypothetical protein